MRSLQLPGGKDIRYLFILYSCNVQLASFSYLQNLICLPDSSISRASALAKHIWSMLCLLFGLRYGVNELRVERDVRSPAEELHFTWSNCLSLVQTSPSQPASHPRLYPFEASAVSWDLCTYVITAGNRRAKEEISSETYPRAFYLILSYSAKDVFKSLSKVHSKHIFALLHRYNDGSRLSLSLLSIPFAQRFACLSCNRLISSAHLSSRGPLQNEKHQKRNRFHSSSS